MNDVSENDQSLVFGIFIGTYLLMILTYFASNLCKANVQELNLVLLSFVSDSVH
jgi:hypothetical protein